MSESSFPFTSMLSSVLMNLYLCVCMITMMMMVSVIIKAIIIISKSCIPPLLLCTPTLFPPHELDGFNYPLKKKTHLNFILKGTSKSSIFS